MQVLLKVSVCAEYRNGITGTEHGIGREVDNLFTAAPQRKNVKVQLASDLKFYKVLSYPFFRNLDFKIE